LEAFVDGVITAQMADAHVVGAQVSVVRNGVVLLSKGYGFADLARRKPVDPATTLFRPGSVTKLFTWTGVMQLVEAKKLDLDTDINKYLDFKVPATFPEPITLRHIMTHSAGFEEDSRNLIGDDPKDLRPMGEWLAAHMPKRVRVPGTYSAYSNYATAVAGYIVERVSGEPWDDYTERHILTPLGMTHTTPRQPLPAALEPDMSVGYHWADGAPEPKKFEILTGAWPAGALSTTAGDMTRFMMAHLGNGALGDVRILGDSTARLMHARVMTHDPRINGFALGFYEQSSHGLRIFGHGGDSQWFHTNLALIPSEGVGIFVSMNTDAGGRLTEPFTERFLDHYYPEPVPIVKAFPGAEAMAARVAGSYLSNRHSYTTYQKALGLAMAAMTVRADSGGRISIVSGGETTHYLPVDSLLYRDELTNNAVAFKAEASGRVIRLFYGNNPTDANERLDWYQTPSLHLGLIGVALAIFGLTVIGAVGRLVRARSGRLRPEDPLPGRAWAVGSSLANVGFAIVIGILASDFNSLLFQSGRKLPMALVLPVAGVVFTLGGLVAAVRQWRTGAGTKGARVRYAAVVAAGVVFAWSLSMWNLLGWRV
jgi:CubicO group peptidase (beta-lactamase class C family)